MLVYTFSTKVHYILENCRREVGISYLLHRGWPFTKGLNVEPEGCTRKCFKRQVFVEQRQR